MRNKKKEETKGIYNFEDYSEVDFEETEDDDIEQDDIEETINPEKNKKMKIITFAIISTVVIIVIANYIANPEFRSYIDIKIFKKQITENTLPTIEINAEDNPVSFAYNDYIGVFSKNTFKIYNSKASEVNKLTINITNPLIETNGKNVVIAEKNGNKFYVINNTNLVWQGKVDGNILNVNINQNGYVSVITTNSTYTSIVVVFDSDGEELFKTFFRSTYAMCSAISTNNSYLAIGEIDYSGTVLKSNIRIMTMDDAKLVHEYKRDNNNIITDIAYYDKENAVCAFTDEVAIVSPSKDSQIYKISKDTYFTDISMDGYLSVLEKQSSGLFSYKYNLKFIMLSSRNENLYILNSMPQKVVSNGKFITLNYGNVVDIVNQNGTLKKNYTSSQQIKDVIVGGSVIGVVYKDKIEIVEV